MNSLSLDWSITPLLLGNGFGAAKIQLELGQLLGIPVDALTPKGLPAKFRDQVIAQAQAL